VARHRTLFLGTCLLSLCASVCLMAPTFADTTPLRVTMFSGPQDLAVFVALEERLYAQRGLAVEVSLTPNSQTLRDGLVDGSFDIASSGVDNAVYVADTG
jgi:ABC-type nitrate/sulfonate/bicarbonate transport system substrate-binding protein